jgi:hypothetical protein
MKLGLTYSIILDNSHLTVEAGILVAGFVNIRALTCAGHVTILYLKLPKRKYFKISNLANNCNFSIMLILLNQISDSLTIIFRIVRITRSHS